MSDANLDAYNDRRNGIRFPGYVNSRHFDQGIVDTIGAKLYEIKPNFFEYFVAIDGITPAGDLPGVPVTFADPEDAYEQYQMPTIGIRLNSFRKAYQRMHSGLEEFRIPSPAANKVVLSELGSLKSETGYDRILIGYQAIPYDFEYTLSVTARHRGAPGQRNQTLLIQNYLLHLFLPDGYLGVLDSEGDRRIYRCTHDGVRRRDEVLAPNDRTLGFSMELMIEGELNTDVPVEVSQVTQRPTITTTIHN